MFVIRERVYAHPIVLFIYIRRLASKEIFSPSNKIILTTLITLPPLSYIIPTVTKNKEIYLLHLKKDNYLMQTALTLESCTGQAATL
jgi:hypothetical protein